MSSSLILKVGALALACASTATATFQYVLVDNYNGSTFFDKMDFFTVSTVWEVECHESFSNILQGR
jgi:hypothetical protein